MRSNNLNSVNNSLFGQISGQIVLGLFKLNKPRFARSIQKNLGQFVLAELTSKPVNKIIIFCNGKRYNMGKKTTFGMYAYTDFYILNLRLILNSDFDFLWIK